MSMVQPASDPQDAQDIDYDDIDQVRDALDDASRENRDLRIERGELRLEVRRLRSCLMWSRQYIALDTWSAAARRALAEIDSVLGVRS